MRLPTLAQVVLFPTTQWQRSQLLWYGGTTAVVDWVTGSALWYSTGTTPLPIRWVLVRDPTGERPIRAFFLTEQAQAAHAIIGDFIRRWPLEVTFEEARAHLDVETQRQWSDLAIERSTPALFGLFTLVVLFAHALYPDGRLPRTSAAWYPKKHVSFHDLLALVRRRIWLYSFLQTGALSPAPRLITHAQFEHLLSAVCY